MKNLRTVFTALKVLLAVTTLTFAVSGRALDDPEEATMPAITDGEGTPAPGTPAPSPSWLERDTLTGDWGGGRTWLGSHGITLKPRLTQFVQGMTAGEGDHGFEYGAKLDLLLKADFSKLGLWDGFSMTVHLEYNFGKSVNGRGGTIAPVNTALVVPGMEGGDAFDLSSVYLGQRFGDSFALLVGKINTIDLGSRRAFAGGAGIDSFWNLFLAAPPTGVLPPAILGLLLSAKADFASFGFWIYDPLSATNKTGFEAPFSEGVTFRGTVDFPVTIGGLRGRQGIVALYSTQDGTSLETPDDPLIPQPGPVPVAIQSARYFFAYTFDQQLYQSKSNPKEGVGIFGQFGISDGNPNKLYWSTLVGVGGTGLIPSRSIDNWGAGFYYVSLSPYLKQSIAPLLTIRDEMGFEFFYNFAVTPWFVLGADLQIIVPSIATTNAVFPGLRGMIRF
jgi:porin